MRVDIFSSLFVGIYSILSSCVFKIEAKISVQSDYQKFQETSTLNNRAEYIKRDSSPGFERAASKPKLFRRARRWRPEEEEYLLDLRDEQQKTWAEIDKLFPDRGWQALESKYSRLTRDPSIPKETKDPSIPWHPKEKERLIELKDKENLSWEEIAEKLPGRTVDGAKGQYNRLSRSFSVPQEIKERWTAEEDAFVKRLGESDMSWEEREKIFTNQFDKQRTLTALQSRLSELAPSQPDKRGRFSDEELDRIVEGIKSGESREEIAQSIGRNKGSLKLQIKRLENLGRLDPNRGGRRYETADLELMREKRKEGMIWDDIAAEFFPGRTSKGLRTAYKKYY